MIDYKIAVPSYERSEVLKNKTLNTLERNKVDPERVTVFVANHDQYVKYREALDDKWEITIAKLGIFECRRFYMTQHYAPGTPVLSLDDDIEKIEQLNENGKLEEFTDHFDDWATTGFKICQDQGSPIWGVYPARNAFYMKNQIVNGLRYIIGCCFGSFAGNRIWTSKRLSDESSAEDFETSLIAWFWFQSMVRMENVTVKTQYFAPGGIDEEVKKEGDDRFDRHEQRLQQIADAYPGLATMKMKAGGRANLRLKSITTTRMPVVKPF